LKLTAVMNIWNSAVWLPWSLRSIYPFVDHVVVCEACWVKDEDIKSAGFLNCPNYSGKTSPDGTARRVFDFIKNEDPDKKVTFLRKGRCFNQPQARNFAIAAVPPDTDWVWQVDCLPGHRTVPVRIGGRVDIMTLEEIYDYYLQHGDVLYTVDGKEIIDCPGLETLSVCGEGLNAEWTQVRRIVRSRSDRDIVRISQKFGEVECTIDHLVGTISTDGDFEFITAGDFYSKLTAGMKFDLVQIEGIINDNPPIDEITLTDWLPLDSSFRTEEDGVLGGTLLKSGLGLPNKLSGSVLFDFCWLLGHYCTSWATWDSYVNNPDLGIFRELCGVGHRNQKVPSFLFALNGKYKEAFLQGVDTQQLHRTSPKLIAGIHLLHKQLGRRFELTWGSGNQDQLEHLGPTSGYVYDLVVPKSRNFCDGIGLVVVHNCDEFYEPRQMLLYRKLMEESPPDVSCYNIPAKCFYFDFTYFKREHFTRLYRYYPGIRCTQIASFSVRGVTLTVESSSDTEYFHYSYVGPEWTRVKACMGEDLPAEQYSRWWKEIFSRFDGTQSSLEELYQKNSGGIHVMGGGKLDRYYGEHPAVLDDHPLRHWKWNRVIG